MPSIDAEKPLTPAEKNALEELKKRWDYKPLDAVSTAFTAGCSLSIKTAEFGPQHYEQKDVSLNKTLWDLWPTEPGSLGGYIDTHQEKADR